MNTSWKETQAKLVVIQEEYNLICRAWRASTNSQRDQQFRDLASACLAELQATIQQYRAETQAMFDAHPALVAPREWDARTDTPKYMTATQDRRRSTTGFYTTAPRRATDRAPRRARRP